MLQNSRYANRVLLHNKAYRSNSRSISVLPIACYLKFLCCLCDNIIAQAGMSNNPGYGKVLFAKLFARAPVPEG